MKTSKTLKLFTWGKKQKWRKIKGKHLFLRPVPLIFLFISHPGNYWSAAGLPAAFDLEVCEKGCRSSTEGWRQIQTTEVQREVIVRLDKMQWWGQQWVSSVIDRSAVRCLFSVFVEAPNAHVKSHEESVYEAQKPGPLFLLQMPDLCPPPLFSEATAFIIHFKRGSSFSAILWLLHDNWWLCLLPRSALWLI